MENKVISAIYSLIESNKEKGLLGELDDIVAANSLFSLFNINPDEDENYKNIDDDIEALKTLYEYNDLNLPLEKFISRVMGELTPRNSEIINKFRDLYREDSQEAIDWYYDISQKTKYIRMDRVIRDKKWNFPSKYGEMEISINLSKPEKDPRDIKKAGGTLSSGYPKCVLCKENVGYKGRVGHPERSNHRIIPLRLNNENWYLQFSPYVYYNQHLIVFSDEHKPMKIDGDTIEELMNFVEDFPELFIGSNAELPIVGGSILNHSHFQGGNYIFPIERAKVNKKISGEDYVVEILDWPVSTIRVKSRKKEILKKISLKIMDEWDEYKNSALEIFPYTEKNGNREKHNTTTLIGRKNGEDYVLYIALRNNRCNERYPYGIFHSHEENHHIKKENVGLIEIMGLAILPGRLNRELEEIKEILVSNGEINENNPHRNWVKRIKEKYGNNINEENLKNILQFEVGDVFVKVLQNCGVFKAEDGEEFKEFVRKAL